MCSKPKRLTVFGLDVQTMLVTVVLSQLSVFVIADLCGYTFAEKSELVVPEPKVIEVCTSKAAILWWTNTADLSQARDKLCYNNFAKKVKK